MYINLLIYIAERWLNFMLREGFRYSMLSELMCCMFEAAPDKG